MKRANKRLNTGAGEGTNIAAFLDFVTYDVSELLLKFNNGRTIRRGLGGANGWEINIETVAKAIRNVMIL